MGITRQKNKNNKGNVVFDSGDKLTRAPGLGKGHGECLLRYGLDLGLELADIVHGSDVPLNFLQQPYDIDASSELQLIGNLLRYTPQPFSAGFHLGCRYQISDLGLFGMALLSSKNGAHAAQIAERYFANAFNFTDMELRIVNGQLQIQWHLRIPLEDSITQFITARDFGICHVVQRYMLDQTASSNYEIGFSFPYLKGMDDVARAFSCPVKYSQDVCYLRLDAKQLSVKPPLSNELNANAIESTYQSILRKTDSESSFRKKVTTILLSNGDMSMDKSQVAQELHMSERTLTRHLEKESITWRQIVREVRLNKAQLLLSASDKSIQVIAAEVGFSSVSAFSRAFVKHIGMSPSLYRRLPADKAQ